MDQNGIERCRLVRVVLDKQTTINDLIGGSEIGAIAAHRLLQKLHSHRSMLRTATNIADSWVRVRLTGPGLVAGAGMEDPPPV